MNDIKTEKPTKITKEEAQKSLNLLDSVCNNVQATRADHLKIVYAVNYLKFLIDEFTADA